VITGADPTMPDEPNAAAEPSASTDATSEIAAGSGRVRRVTQIVLVVCVILFLWYVRADRLTPYTDQATIRSLIVPIVPQVSGYLVEADVRLHSPVEEGQVIFQIDKRLYEAALRRAEADVDRATQEMGAKGAAVKSATGRLGVARAQLDRAQRYYNRTARVRDENPGALSQADLDRAETSLAQAVERVASAEADLEKAKEQLGVVGPDNPQLRVALAALEQAQLNLAFTTIHAPADGVIESYNVDVGFYATAGQPLATFLSPRDVWIQANMRENNLSHIEPGDRVEIALDVAPGRIFKGRVRSIGYGVATEGSTTRGDLPTVSSSKGWLRDPQRFPVIIAVEDDIKGLRRVGGQADVIVYAGGDPILKLIGKLQIRVRSWISYVR